MTTEIVKLNCPISDKWGANNVTVDNSCSDNFPIGTSKNVRTYIKALI